MPASVAATTDRPSSLSATAPIVERMGNKHSWATGKDECAVCGLLRGTAWFTDDSGQPVELTLWMTPGRQVVRIRPNFTRQTPPSETNGYISEVLAGIETGGVPACPKTPQAWTSA